MRARHPAQFSDSAPVGVSTIDRPTLEFRLATMTSRNEETLFANFAFQLAKREICPNLLPQTGPVGGGDSKVDSETIPVADALSLIWFTALAREAASERWAFAFSAKGDWRAKVKADIAKLAATGRGYAQAFFITNQAVPDKRRAQVEDALSKKHGMAVHILDRTWILDRVFSNHREELAVQELHLSVSRSSVVRRGPKDIQRENDLREIEARIAEAVTSGSTGFQFVEDCIKAPLLAREIERPRTEVEGLFTRAERVSREHGTSHQSLVSLYNHAWTAFWWYEDYELLNALYADVETLAQGSRNACELELLTNLWTLLRTAVASGFIRDTAATLDDRRTSLAANLERLATEVDRPSTSLQARTHLLQLRLFPESGYDPAVVLGDLRGVVRQAETLIGYPFDAVAQLLIEFGDVLGHLPEYESLFEELIGASARRNGEIARARLLLVRGRQQLAAEKPYEAIRSLGRSLEDLCKYEARGEIVQALYLCGSGYEQAGLLWAARGTVLHAASIATNDFWSYEEVTGGQIACYARMKWLELQLGRMLQALAWFEIEMTMRGIGDQATSRDRIAEDLVQFDAMLGVLLLRADLSQLALLTQMPEVLDRLGLYNAAVALRYSLGYEDEVPAEYGAPAGSEMIEFFRRWRDQPASADLPDRPKLSEGAETTLRGRILGCVIEVTTPTDRVCVELSEALLAALESFASTVLSLGGVAREPLLTIAVTVVSSEEPIVAFELEDLEGRPRVSIRCAAINHKMITVAERKQVHDTLVSIVAAIFGRVLLIEDLEASLVTLIRDERAMVRAVPFAGSYFASNNVMGHEAKTTLGAWTSGLSVCEYPVKRHQEWDAADRSVSTAAAAKEELQRPGKGEAPPDLFDLSRLRHDKIEVRSHIRETLWNRAGWQGVLYQVSVREAVPPVIALLFANEKAAAQIFSEWRREIGAIDKDEELRISIVRGVDNRNLHHYRMIVGSRFRMPPTEASTVFYLARMHTMEAVTGENLDRFITSYRKFGQYVLAYAVINEATGVPSLRIGEGLAKREIGIREAWEIGRHDSDGVGVFPGDNPVVPTEHVSDAPVLELLAFKRKQQHQ